MKREPIDYNSPLGINKREWTRVLGVNLALLLAVYAVALICTLCGSDLFLLNFHSDDLQRIEETLRGWNVFFLLQMALSVPEEVIVLCYSLKTKPKWWWPLAFFAYALSNYFIFRLAIGHAPSWLASANGISFAIGFVAIYGKFKIKKRWDDYARLGISLAVTFILQGAISVLRTASARLYQNTIENSVLFALLIEYNLALALTLGFLTALIPWRKGEEKWTTTEVLGGSSPTTTKMLPKPSKIARTDLPPRQKKRLRWLKIKFIIVQTLALIVISALPWLTGRPIEYTIVYVSFCLTRMVLGFTRSLHFKSELLCVTVGALTFWGLTYLTPNVETSIILSLCYGAGLALGFRLYWELHDLMMYKKAAKTDRFAMLYGIVRVRCEPIAITLVNESEVAIATSNVALSLVRID